VSHAIVTPDFPEEPDFCLVILHNNGYIPMMNEFSGVESAFRLS
jgi:hypothetical protein